MKRGRRENKILEREKSSKCVVMEQREGETRHKSTVTRREIIF